MLSQRPRDCTDLTNMKASVFTVLFGLTVLLVEANPEPYVPSRIKLQSRKILGAELSRYRRRSGLATQLQRRETEKLGAQNVALLDYFNGTDLQ